MRIQSLSSGYIEPHFGGNEPIERSGRMRRKTNRLRVGGRGPATARCLVLAGRPSLGQHIPFVETVIGCVVARYDLTGRHTLLEGRELMAHLFQALESPSLGKDVSKG